ncbi:hypothetical protein [Streptomyces sp. NBC_01803]|uniref:hypothetical protein n=1 Tax=Streptomyces sp. NBC_01803 TaxID=2975946 RepID=UPI002DDBE3AE|nr:hypothetical protein [Streptomyces sp. NBC_01803]WSA47253.1 hypothetical protein OIE51_25580 [Streptomyces sp. NBC_01803]
MAHTTRRGRRSADPWGEAAGTVAVVADETGFALMRRYASFRFTDHAGYLRRTEELLRSMSGRHGHTSVALFDPAGFAEFCEREGLPPDDSASRARYTAEVAARGATVPYEGQPLARLVPALLAETVRWETWELGTDLLAAAGSCPRCGAPMSRCAFQRAAGLLTEILQRAEPGTHHLVCSLIAETGPLMAALTAGRGEEGSLELPEPEALVLCTLLAVGVATGDPGGLVLRSRAGGAERGKPGGSGEQVRGWSLTGGRLRGLSEAEVFAAYCTDARTGEPVPPEHGVVYRGAEDVGPGRCAEP